VATGVSAFGDEMPGRVERLDIVTGARIRYVEHATSEQLKKEPGTPAKSPGRFPPQPILQGGSIDRFHRSGDHAEVERLMPQRKTQMRDDRAVRRVLSRIELDGVRPVDFSPPCAGDDITLAAGRWHRKVQITAEPSLANRLRVLNDGVRHPESLIVV
jgi:hypothetical protein